MVVTLMLAAVLARATALDISPWVGKDMPTALYSAAAKSQLTITGTPGTKLGLQAKNFAQGWLPAFCTATLCAPVRVVVTLPRSGVTRLQFELVRETQNAPQASGAIIVSSDGASVVVPSASR